MGNPIPQSGEPIIFFDVESLPAPKDDPLWMQLAATIERENDDEEDEVFEVRVEEIRRKSALYAPLGRAWMIGWAMGKKEPTTLASDGTLEGEKQLLEHFYEEMAELDNPWWVGHNIVGYDIPFLQVRALYHGLPRLARMFGSPLTKPWDLRVLDTMKLWPRTGADRSSWRDGIRGLAKLDTICAVLGVPQQEGVMGRSVYDAFLSGDHEGVKSHLVEDIIQVREVFKKLWPTL